VELLDQPDWTANDEDDFKHSPNEIENGDDDADHVIKKTLKKSFSGFSLDDS
jgi:hypothetical protein